MTGFDYGNARLRVRASSWLTGADYRDLLGTSGLDALLGALARGPYGGDVARAMARYRGVRRLDEAIRMHLARELTDVRSFYEDEVAARIGAFLARWDFRNVRAVLRDVSRRRREAPSSDLMVPVGALGASELAEVAGQQDVRSAVDLLTVWRLPSPGVIRHLRRAIPDFLETGDVLVLERALDRAFADHVEAVVDAGRDRVAEALTCEVDRINVVSFARLSGAARPPADEDVFEPLGGGRVTRDTWRGLVGSDRSSAVSRLIPRLPAAWSGALSSWAEGGAASALALRLEDAAATQAISAFRTGDALGIDIPLGYIAQQEAEAKNLRLIGRAVDQDLERDEAYGTLLGVA